MPFHLRFLDGGIVTLEKNNLDYIDIVRAVGEYTAEPQKGYLGVFKEQIVMCRGEEKDDIYEILNILIKPIFEIPYVNGFDVSQYYRKNDTEISHYPDKVIWVNDVSRHHQDRRYEFIRWNSIKNISTSTVSFLHTSKEELQAVHDSSEISPIAKERLYYLIGNQK